MSYELRQRGYDEEETSLPLMFPAERLGLIDVLRLADKLGSRTEVWENGAYVISAGNIWNPPGGPYHQLSSHGWCHDCRDEGLGYVHHLSLVYEHAALAAEAMDDQVARRMCEADGLTPAQYADQFAGKDVPLWDDQLYAVWADPYALPASNGLQAWRVTMKDGSAWLVTVPADHKDGAGHEALRIAEEWAFAADTRPKRCYDCKGTRGHASDCSVTREREFLAKYPHLAACHDEG
jgi:hypothetical protein